VFKVKAWRCSGMSCKCNREAQCRMHFMDRRPLRMGAFLHTRRRPYVRPVCMGRVYRP